MEERVGVKVQENPTVILPYEPEQEYWIAPVDGNSKKRIYHIVKRMLDVAASFVALIILAIPMAVIALIIVLDSPGPAIFRQKRIGKDGKAFTIFKFRTLYTYAPSDVATNSLNTTAYITRVGKFLRLYSLDELPQLWNVLIGNMSFVGYRPVCLSEQQLNQHRAECGVLTTKPGITGYAQINGRDNVSMDDKVRLDLYYVNHCSILFDLRCILKTVKVALTKEGAN